MYKPLISSSYFCLFCRSNAPSLRSSIAKSSFCVFRKSCFLDFPFCFLPQRYQYEDFTAIPLNCLCISSHINSASFDNLTTTPPSRYPRQRPHTITISTPPLNHVQAIPYRPNNQQQSTAPSKVQVGYPYRPRLYSQHASGCSTSTRRLSRGLRRCSESVVALSVRCGVAKLDRGQIDAVLCCFAETGCRGG